MTRILEPDRASSNVSDPQSTRGMAVAPHALAAQAAVSVLRDGGNAIEAMVAAASTIAVVYPHMNGMGGDGFWTISHPDAPVVAIEACGSAAAAASRDYYGSRGCDSIPTRGPDSANTVAGTVGGWSEALAISASWAGRLPLARLLEDASMPGSGSSGTESSFQRDGWQQAVEIIGQCRKPTFDVGHRRLTGGLGFGWV